MIELTKSYHPVQKISVRAEDEIPARRFISAFGKVCQPTEVAIGVSEIAWTKGNTMSVITLGTVLVDAAESIGKGDKISVATDGRAQKKTTDSDWIAIALSNAGAGGQVKAKLVV
jgi:hypothetical protein